LKRGDRGRRIEGEMRNIKQRREREINKAETERGTKTD
jgi:hypothetical protein